MGKLKRTASLKLRPREEYSADSFRVGVNQNLFNHLYSNQNIWFYGASGLGKTHVAHILVARTENAILVNASAYDLDGIESFALVILDSIELWLGSLETEKRVFELYERLQRYGGRLVITARKKVSEYNYNLVDLCSRLETMRSFQLQPLPDREKMLLVQELARLRGFEVSDSVVQFIFKYVGRAQGLLIHTLDTLENESLIHNRRITIPFLKQVLNL